MLLIFRILTVLLGKITMANTQQHRKCTAPGELHVPRMDSLAGRATFFSYQENVNIKRFLVICSKSSLWRDVKRARNSELFVIVRNSEDRRLKRMFGTRGAHFCESVRSCEHPVPWMASLVGRSSD